MLKRLIYIVLPASWYRLLRNFWLLSEIYGQRISTRDWQCRNKNGEEIPWYTYPAIEYLAGLDFKSATVLEFGSGSSSIWWSNRVASVLAVEHNKEWYQQVSARKVSGLKTILAEAEEAYLEAGSGRKYDVIVIDGVHRQRCAELAGQMLNSDGMVILDNSDWYPDAAKTLREQNNLLQVDFHGFGPINDYTWTTSLFFSRTFNCTPSASRLPQYSAGALVQLAEGQNG